MKIKLLFTFFFVGLLGVSAQFTIKDDRGRIFNDGDIFEFGTTDYPDAELLFFVTNDSSETIFSRIEYVNHINAENPLFGQLCYGVECYFGIEPGGTVPPRETEAVAIAPGETTGMGNHFYSNDLGLEEGTVDFVFAFKLYEDLMSANEVGETLTITYRYNPSLGVDAVSKVDLSLHATVVTDRLVMDVNEPVEAVIYDMQGRQIKQTTLNVGQQEWTVSDLSSQSYLIKFKSATGATKTSRFIVR